MPTTTGHRSAPASAGRSTSEASSEDTGPTLSLPQILGGALAAVTSAFAASFLGVTGTLTGAFLGSLVATVGAAVYADSLKRAGRRLRTVRPSPATGAVPSVPGRDVKLLSGRKDDADALVFVSRRKPAARRWLRLGVGVASALGIALAAITALELALGHPVSGATRSGTTIGGAVSGGARADRPDRLPNGSAASTTGTARPTTTRPSTSPTTVPSEPAPPSATSGQFGATAAPDTGPTTGSDTGTRSTTNPTPSSTAAGQPAG